MPARTGLSFIDSARVVLADAESALNCRQIVTEAMRRGLLHTSASTPQNTLSALLREHIVKQSSASHFVQTARGKFALTEAGVKAARQHLIGLQRA